MRKRLIAACALLFLLLSASARAVDLITPIDYWPYDGVWFYFYTDGGVYFRDTSIFVYCGYACTEWVVGPWSDNTEQWFHDPVSHNTFQDSIYWYGQVEYFDPFGESLFDGYLHASWDCYDIRSYLNQEYVDFGVYADASYIPGCSIGGSGLTQGPGYGPFPFSALNDGLYTWAVIRYDYLYSFTAQIQYNVGYNIRVTSGYRDPWRNASVGGNPSSRHMWGCG